LISAQLAAYNSADPTVHVSYCHLLSFVIHPFGVNYIKIFSSKTTRQFQPKFAWIILKYVSTGTLKVQCISDNPTNHPADFELFCVKISLICIFSAKTGKVHYVNIHIQNVCHTFHLNGTTVQISAQLVVIFGFISSVDGFTPIIYI
jgi:hypothetical protein